MRTYINALLASSALFIAIPNGLAQKERKSNPHEPGDDICKHYTGTIGNREVAMDVIFGYQGGSNYGGSSYYFLDEPGIRRFFIGEPDTFKSGVTLHADQVPDTVEPGDRFYDRSKQLITFNFRIAENKLRGKWQSADKKVHYDIDLSESYSNSVPVDIVVYYDKATTTNSRSDTFKAFQWVMCAVPSPSADKDAATFIQKSLAQFLSCGTIPADSVVGYVQGAKQKYFSEFESNRERISTEKLAVNRPGYNGYSSVNREIHVLPSYNDDGFIAFERWGFGTGINGEFSVLPSTYLALDVRSRNILTADDMLDINNPDLQVMVENAFRRQYHVAAPNGLKEVLSVDKLPVTRKVVPSHKGLMFMWSSSDVLPKDKFGNDVKVFVPYTSLATVLNPNFKKRLGL